MMVDPMVELAFRQVLDHAVIPSALVDLKGRVLLANHAAGALLGRAEGELVGTDVGRIIHPDDRTRREEVLQRLRTGETPSAHQEERYLRADGSIVWVIASRTLVRHPESGDPLFIFVQLQDISELKLAAQALRTSEERFRLLAENAQDFIFRVVVEPDIRFDYVSPASTRVLGYTPEELYADPSLIFDMVSEEYVEAMRERDRQGEFDQLWEVQIKRKDGSRAWAEARYTVLRGEDDRVYAVEGIVRDISERKKAQYDLEHLALHDSLTQLPNRPGFMDHLRRALARAVRSESNLAVLFVDLDGLKAVNDRFGHEAGDHLLFSAGGRIQRCIRPADVLARLGGDEFTILCEDITDPQQAVSIAARVVESFQKPFRIAAGEVFASASVGVAVSDGSDSASAVLQAADHAMYQAKARGKARYEVAAGVAAD